jgi:hypothetical protein
MGGQKRLCLQQGHQSFQSLLFGEVSVPRCLPLKPSPPILLPLTRNPREPPTDGDLPEKAQKEDKPDHPKPPIIELGPQSVDRPTVRTTIPPKPQRFWKIIKIPAHITMSPQSRASASRAPRRTRPRILLPHFFQKIDIDGKIQYQERVGWGITGGSSPGKESPSVIPFCPFSLL